MRKLIAYSLLVACSAVTAQTVSGNVFCSGTNIEPFSATVSISGTFDSNDAGLPGAVWVSIEDPANPGSPAAFLTQSGWVAWSTAGFPAYVETQSMNSGFSYTACIPGSPYGTGCAPTSASFVGWKIYAGYGVLTPEHQALIAQRRASLDLAKPWLQQQGKWRPEYEDDVAYRNALVQKSANDGRWGLALTVPYIDCTPPDSGS